MQLAQGVAVLIALYGIGWVALVLYATAYELQTVRVKSRSSR